MANLAPYRVEVVCETPGCSQHDLVINAITGIATRAAVTTILDDWADAHDWADVCRSCGQLGVPYEACDDVAGG